MVGWTEVDAAQSIEALSKQVPSWLPIPDLLKFLPPLLSMARDLDQVPVSVRKENLCSPT